MRCLLTGGTGLLGLDLLGRLPPDWEVLATLHRHRHLEVLGTHIAPASVDLTDREAVSRAVAAFRPEAIVHAASIGDLDFCERNPEAARRANVDATRWLLEASQPHEPLFVFISTIYVFDGTHPPYDEEAPPHPLGVYAQTKLEAERLVRSTARRPIVLRPMTLYGWHLPAQRTNCVTWLLQKLALGEPLKIVDDVYNNHLWVGDASRAVLAALKREACGVFHLGGPRSLSRYELSCKVADVFGYDRTRLSPVGSDFFPSLAPRPRDSTCRIERMQQVLGVHPLDPDRGLERMRAALPDWPSALCPARGLFDPHAPGTKGIPCCGTPD